MRKRMQSALIARIEFLTQLPKRVLAQLIQFLFASKRKKGYSVIGKPFLFWWLVMGFTNQTPTTIRQIAGAQNRGQLLGVLPFVALDEGCWTKSYSLFPPPPSFWLLCIGQLRILPNICTGSAGTRFLVAA